MLKRGVRTDCDKCVRLQLIRHFQTADAMMPVSLFAGMLVGKVSCVDENIYHLCHPCCS